MGKEYEHNSQKTFQEMPNLTGNHENANSNHNEIPFALTIVANTSVFGNTKYLQGCG